MDVAANNWAQCATARAAALWSIEGIRYIYRGCKVLTRSRGSNKLQESNSPYYILLRGSAYYCSFHAQSRPAF